jgi:hypothetical protein
VAAEAERYRAEEAEKSRYTAEHLEQRALPREAEPAASPRSSPSELRLKHGSVTSASLYILGALAAIGAAIAFRHEIGALVGWLAKGLHLSAQAPVASSSPEASEVDVSAFAPMRAGRGEQFLVQVFLHDPDAEARTIQLVAKAADPEAVRRGMATLDVDVALGERLDFMAHRGERLQTGGLESRFKAGITRVFEIL